MAELKTMKIGNGRERVEGVSKKIRGYAPRVGKSLAELLKENNKVKMVSMGGDAASIMVKAIAHAQQLLKEENRDLVANEFAFEEAEMTNYNGSTMKGKVITVIVELV